MLVLLLALLACKGTDTDTDGPECRSGDAWAPGAPAFREATDDWGLPDLDVTGLRITAVDFDLDGWPDLYVRYGNAPDDFAGTRTGWLLRNTGHGSFEDVTEASGVRQGRDGLRGGELAAWGDVDNDGDLDLLSGLHDRDGAYPGETTELYLAQGDGTFALGREGNDYRIGPGDSPMGLSFADVDLDGALDLWVTEYDTAQDRLYQGDGSGRFDEVTHDRGLTTRAWSQLSVLNNAEGHSVAWSSTACDLNDDGYPELLAASYGRAPNHLWLNAGDGTFTNHSVESGYAYDDRMDWTDNESARCWCHLHPDADDCEGVPAPERIRCESDSDAFRWNHDYDREPFRLGGNSGTTVCRDVDNDGHADLLTTEIVHWDVGQSSDPSELLFNRGDATFERPGNEATGLVREHSEVDWNDGDMTAAVFDFDNDGWPDVYIGSSDYPGTRGLLFHQDAPREFSPVSLDDGIDHTRSHGVAVADFDRDGDQDVVVGHGPARCADDCRDNFRIRLFENVAGDNANFVRLRLVGGEGSNRAAIGARVEVTAGDLTQVQEVGGGHGQAGYQDELVRHFGLGEACSAEVTVTWPDAAHTTQTFTVDAGAQYAVVQGSAPVAE